MQAADMRRLRDLMNERVRQIRKFGVQHHPDGTHPSYHFEAVRARTATNAAAMDGSLTWEHILEEEFYEAMAETEWPLLRAELVQVAAVCLAWMEDGDERE